jgi:hypothetical protein
MKAVSFISHMKLEELLSISSSEPAWKQSHISLPRKFAGNIKREKSTDPAEELLNRPEGSEGSRNIATCSLITK